MDFQAGIDSVLHPKWTDPEREHRMSNSKSCCCFVVVPNDRMAVVERCGQFTRVVKPGFNPVICCAGECMAGDVSMRVQQLDVVCETKTKDNVFVHTTVSVQYEVQREKLYEAFYKLTDPRSQMTAYIYDVVRSSLPKINLDEVFDSKDEIAKAIKQELISVMSDFGFNIIQALVTDISPNERVKAAMNEINAATRRRAAAAEKAEAEKILVVKAAEADAESKHLQGVGISRQRQAIVDGLQQSVVAFTDHVGEVSPKDVLQLMLMTQYFDMMRDVGTQARSSVVFVPHSPGSVADVGGQVRDAMLQANAAKVAPKAQEMGRGVPAMFGDTNP
jgi:regulator of protease activity HflC (stomatin/prohibitin superfamily)